MDPAYSHAFESSWVCVCVCAFVHPAINHLCEGATVHLAVLGDTGRSIFFLLCVCVSILSAFQSQLENISLL